MDVIARWKIAVCPICRRFVGGRTGCAGSMSEPHEKTRTMWVDVVPASQLEGAVGALRKIAEQAEAAGEQWSADMAEDALDRLGITTNRGQ
jgi:hypothetical protein